MSKWKKVLNKRHRANPEYSAIEKRQRLDRAIMRSAQIIKDKDGKSVVMITCVTPITKEMSCG